METTLGFKLYKVSDDLHYCSPVAPAAYQPLQAVQTSSCSCFSYLKRTATCSCGITAYSSLRDCLLYAFIMFEQDKTLDAQTRGNPIDYKYVIAIVEGKDVENETYGWRSREVEIKTFLSIDWNPDFRYEMMGKNFIDAKVSGGIEVMSGTSYKYPTYLEIFPGFERFFYLNGDKDIQNFFVDKEGLRKLSNNLDTPFSEDKRWYEQNRWKTLAKRLRADLVGINFGLSPEEFLERKQSIADAVDKRIDTLRADRPLRKDFRCSTTKENQAFNQAALGFRIWRGTNAPLLTSLTNKNLLTPGIRIAECERGCDPFPGETHHCGWNAFSSLEELFASPYIKRRDNNWNTNYIIGAVAGMGELRVHDDHGWRSERMSPIALLAPKAFSYSGYRYPHMFRIAEYFDIPLFFNQRIFEEYSLSQASIDYLDTAINIGADRDLSF